MSLGAKRALWRFMIFGGFGMLMEVCAMSIGVGMHGNLSLRGASSPWMFPIYGLIGLILEPVAAPLRERGVPLPVRALLYIVLFYIVEFSSGLLYLYFGINQRGVDNMHTVWDYGNTRTLYGQVSLDMLPFWYLFCFTLEYLYVRVDACATVLARRLRASDLLAG
ncbi:MAG: hypothetical protein GC168_15695 [Candidatus Hydrogenedens sp.]|nr:hypothetical protein [Candidatus Hydrogenedens sp.]